MDLKDCEGARHRRNKGKAGWCRGTQLVEARRVDELLALRLFYTPTWRRMLSTLIMIIICAFGSIP